MESLSREQTSLRPVESLQRIVHEHPQATGWCEDIENGPDGVYLSSELPAESQELLFSNVVELSTLRLGAVDSMHEVAFASIDIEGADGQFDVQTVAVKQFKDDMESAMLEFNSLQAVAEKGIDTLRPLGLIKDSNETYLLTSFRPDISSMDNHRWNVRPGEEGYEALCENLAFIADTMGLMHANGIFHGDVQPKNFVRNDIGDPVVIDLEAGSAVLETGSANHIEAFGRRGSPTEPSASQDLRQFWLMISHFPIGTHNGNTFLGENATAQDYRQTFETHFIKPYIKSLGKHCSDELLMSIDYARPIVELQEAFNATLAPLERSK